MLYLGYPKSELDLSGLATSYDATVSDADSPCGSAADGTLAAVVRTGP
jgi:hypothetical protein